MHNYLETSGSIKCAKQLDGHPKAGGVKLLAPDKLGPAHPLWAPGRGRRIQLLDRIGSAQPPPSVGGSMVALLCPGPFGKHI